jgi:uncharacterized protein YjeT (DUF2065 family)
MLELNLQPDDATLRRFGLIALVVFGGLAGLLYTGRTDLSAPLAENSQTLAAASGGLALLSGLFSSVFPRGNRPLFVGLTLLTFPVGLVLSHLVLLVLFFAVITPVAGIMRVIGRDPLQRRFDESKASYWVQAGPPPDKESYFRQY